MIFQPLFTLTAFCLYLPNIGRCEGCSGSHYFRFNGPHHLVAVVLRHHITKSIAPCFYICNNLSECTGFAVFSVNDTLDCTFLNTDAETIGALRTHLQIPLADIPNFSFYTYSERQGKVGNIRRSPGSRWWRSSSHWSTLNDYLTHGRLTGIRVWYGVVSHARFIHGIQIQYNGIWTSVYGESIGTKGEVLLGNGETIATVRYTINRMKTTHMEFTTSKGTTFGPFGWEDEEEVVTFVVQTRKLLWLSGGVAGLWTADGTFRVIRPIYFYY